MRRYPADELLRHYHDNRQMLFLSGPRQVGKTTIAQQIGKSCDNHHYLNWDNHNHRDLLLQGPAAIAAEIGLKHLQAGRSFCAFDELHKYVQWQDFLKGFFEPYGEQAHVLLTSSAQLNSFKRGGDSLMGRYFPYTLRPASFAELSSSAKAPLSPALSLFQQQTGAKHAFQVAMDAPFVARDCFAHSQPLIVPTRTLLAQLV